ncbi:MAG TPA: N-acetyl-gamma-glutamyl-phosphate reductase [Candidatus Fraserbacteria bacterium]|nr:N-acetyl-gamma-glutamyl-phosphate reductase [Candidatus Fraserbacteria bacterium]
MKRYRVAIAGGSGYAGGELLRLLLRHPGVQLVAISSRSQAGRSVYKIHPNLRGATELKFSRPEELEPVELLFTALPHGRVMRQIEFFMSRAERIVDLSADFRLKDPRDYPSYYGYEHRRPELLKEFVYGLPELHREEIKGAHLVAVPGCTAAAAITPLKPLTEQFGVKLVVVDAKVGSSAAGAAASPAGHHPERAGVVRSFKPTGHRHLAEMKQELDPHDRISLNFSPHAVEMVRGILSTSHVFLEDDYDERTIWQCYLEAYGQEPFVRLVKERTGLYRYPEPKLLLGTNFCDIGFERDARTGRLVVISALDNLTKGAAGQAVQCMNLMLGLDERLGLNEWGFHPV